MIVKELDNFTGRTPIEGAGHRAEDKMAFFLKKKYEMNDEVMVINNLRFSWQGDFTQIDHLIIFRYGMVIIEDKSVSSKLKYNKDQEFFRLWDNHWKPMDNPVKQAERQRDSLLNLLHEHRTEIIYPLLGGIQPGFRKFPIHCLVSISQNCNRITREYEEYDNCVVKAERITERIDEIIQAAKKADGMFSLSIPWRFEKDEATRAKDFLLSVHVPASAKEMEEEDISETKETEKQTASTPKTTNAPQDSVSTEEKPKDKEPSKLSQAPEKASPTDNSSKPQKEASQSEEDKIHTLTSCPDCNGKVSILWGAKYKNYYWHCNECGKNISINFKCPGCHEKLKIRKQGVDYFIYCEPCHLEAPYFRDEK